MSELKSVPKAQHRNGVGVDSLVKWVQEVSQEDSLESLAVVAVRRDGGMVWHHSNEIGVKLIGALSVLKADIERQYIDSD